MGIPMALLIGSLWGGEESNQSHLSVVDFFLLLGGRNTTGKPGKQFLINSLHVCFGRFMMMGSTCIW